MSPARTSRSAPCALRESTTRSRGAGPRAAAGASGGAAHVAMLELAPAAAMGRIVAADLRRRVADRLDLVASSGSVSSYSSATPPTTSSTAWSSVISSVGASFVPRRQETGARARARLRTCEIVEVLERGSNAARSKPPTHGCRIAPIGLGQPRCCSSALSASAAEDRLEVAVSRRASRTTWWRRMSARARRCSAPGSAHPGTATARTSNGSQASTSRAPAGR